MRAAGRPVKAKSLTLTLSQRERELSSALSTTLSPAPCPLSPNMIHLTDVSKTYKTANGPVHALANVVLDVAKGEFVAVRGPSGCGKSTLLMIVGALGSPTSGTVTVGGENLLAMSAAARARFRARRVGFVFQMFHLLPYLTVLENVAAAALPGQVAAARDRAGELLRQFHLADRAGHRPAELVRRRAPTRGYRPGDGQPAGTDSGRRADGQPRLRECEGRARPAGRVSPPGGDGAAGDPRRTSGHLRRTYPADEGRIGRRRLRRRGRFVVGTLRGRAVWHKLRVAQ